jgi:hypothetical protein
VAKVVIVVRSGVFGGKRLVTTVVLVITGPGGVITTTLPLVLVPLCALEVLDAVPVAGTVPALAFEVLEAVLVVEMVPALAPVGSAPSILYTALAIDHHAASSMISS